MNLAWDPWPCRVWLWAPPGRRGLCENALRGIYHAVHWTTLHFCPSRDLRPPTPCGPPAGAWWGSLGTGQQGLEPGQGTWDPALSLQTHGVQKGLWGEAAYLPPDNSQGRRTPNVSGVWGVLRITHQRKAFKFTNTARQPAEECTGVRNSGWEAITELPDLMALQDELEVWIFMWNLLIV